MAQSIPIGFNEVFNLANPPLSVAPDCIKNGLCAMESDKYITICEKVGDAQNVVIVDMSNPTAAQRMKMGAEAAIMNPNSKILAVRAAQTIQIYNLDTKAKLGSADITGAVSFWRWINATTVAIVTNTAVFHWSYDAPAPVKVCDRHADFNDKIQIIGYQVSGDGKWNLICGISQGATPGTIVGTMQLSSLEKGASQILNGHTGVFTVAKVPGRDDLAQLLCFEDAKPNEPPKLQIMEVGRDKSLGPGFRAAPQPIPVAADAVNDFPVTMNASKKYNMVFMISRMGYLFVFDIITGKPIYRSRITQDVIFVTAEHSPSGGILGITRKGQVLLVTINEANLVPFILGQLKDQQLALDLASRLNLSGVDDLYVSSFNALLAGGDIAGAAKMAADSPRGILRTNATIARFQQIPPQPGQPAPLSQYFSALLEKGKLNQTETMELARPLVQQGRARMLEKYINEDKLEVFEELGDLLVASDVALALSVYSRLNVPEKTINCMFQVGEYDKVIAYATRVGYKLDYALLLQQLVRTNPSAALDFAKKIYSNNGGVHLIEAKSVLDIFMQVNLLQQASAFLLDALQGNRPEEGFLQTKLLEINLLGGSPQVADAIIGNGMFTYYDRPYIGRLCEQCGLTQRALEHYADINDIKRVANAPNVSPEFLISYFGTISREGAIEVLKEMLARNMRQNLNVVVQIATKYSENLGPDNLIKLFEDFKSFEGLFYYLGGIVNFSQNPLVIKKYIEAAARMQQFKEVERVCRDSNYYDPVEVKKYLIEAKLPDPRALIHVCDRFDFIDELVAYLFSNNLHKFLEVYVQKVAPQKTPQVIGKLLDLECNEDFVKNLLNSVGQMCPVADLVAQVERRNRLRLLHPWLEARIAQGNTEPATHNAIGKIYITLNRDPVQFLNNNQFYEPKVLGSFCEKLDPHLAFIAYKHANGECDDDLIRVCQENGLYKDLARYLVERQDLDLWSRVLKPEGYQEGDEEPPSRRYLLDQVVQTALPETRNGDEVSTTVKAFMQNDLPGELIEILERMILQGSEFSNNRNLQNLLLLTAIRASREKVMEYINRLDNFDGTDIAKMAASDQHCLYEEALTIYVKFAKKATGEEQVALQVSAVEILVDKIRDLDRAKEFAERVNAKAVWSKLAKAQLDADQVSEAIQSYIKAKDPSDYIQVISAAEQAENYEVLVPYLKMARKDIKEATLDTQLIYSLARINRLSELEEFVSVPNVAKIDVTGERCFDEGLFEAAKILFASINNNSKLALCYVKLSMYREAVDAATKANSVPTWKEVNLACLKAQEFRLANICGLHIIVHPDHLPELISHYEHAGRFGELMQLLEQGLGLDNAHTGIFTELGILYSKYNPEKLMEHIKIFWSRMNVVKLLRACEKALLWHETVYLYKEDGQHDAAVRTMIDHPTGFIHDLFLDCVQKVRNPEIQYKAVGYYATQHPLQLGRLLQVLTPNLDHARVIHQLRKLDALPLAMEYMKSVQKENLSAVNEALNEMYIAEEDFESLRSSVDDFDNFDQLYLAQRVEKHELLEFRRIAAYLYKKNKRWAASVHLSKEDSMFKDAIDTAAESADIDIAEDLLRFFVSIHDRACFAATLYTCYDLIRPDVALELAWRHGFMDYSMPFLIQYIRHAHDKIKGLEERTAPTPMDQSTADATQAAVLGPGMMGEPLMITNGPMGFGAPAGGFYGDPYASTGMDMNLNLGGMGGMPGMPGMNGMGAMGMNMGNGMNGFPSTSSGFGATPSFPSNGFPSNGNFF